MMTVRRIEEGDLEGAARLEQICFPEPWSVRSLHLLLEDGAFGAVAVEDGQVVGYGGMLIVPGEGQITNIAVSPEARRRGIGRMILSRLLREAEDRGLEQVVLEVRKSNLPALSLYEDAGFLPVGERKNFYRHPTEDAQILAVRFSDSAAE